MCFQTSGWRHHQTGTSVAVSSSTAASSRSPHEGSTTSMPCRAFDLCASLLLLLSRVPIRPYLPGCSLSLSSSISSASPISRTSFPTHLCKRLPDVRPPITPCHSLSILLSSCFAFKNDLTLTHSSTLHRPPIGITGHHPQLVRQNEQCQQTLRELHGSPRHGAILHSRPQAPRGNAITRMWVASKQSPPSAHLHVGRVRWNIPFPLLRLCCHSGRKYDAWQNRIAAKHRDVIVHSTRVWLLSTG